MVSVVCGRKIGRSARKAQISVEYVAGFSIFIVVVAYIIYMSLVVFPKYYETSRNNALREEAWSLSEKMMQYLLDGNAIGGDSLGSFSLCTPCNIHDTSSEGLYSMANYTYLKNVFYVDGDNDFRATVVVKPVIVLDDDDGVVGGSVVIDGETYDFIAGDSGAGVGYDQFDIYDSSGTLVADDIGAADKPVIGGLAYDVVLIDSDGKIIILSRELADCGMYISYKQDSAKVLRFSTYDGLMTEVEIVYW